MSTKVVILGKPNVGKSSLFNVFLKKNIAIVHDLPGLTRDIRKKKLKLWDKECELFDTPGLKDAGNDLEKDIIKSTLHYANYADLIILVFDGKSELTGLDLDILQTVRKLNKKILIVLNKTEGIVNENIKVRLQKKGFGNVILISASHNQNIDQLKWLIYECLEDSGTNKIERENHEKLSIAIIGKTNTGKSTIFNLINNKNISLTGSEPNLTRDAVESNTNLKDVNFKIFDTAGFSNKNKEKVNKLSTDQTLKKIRLSKLILMIFDINNYYEKINSKIVRLIYNENRCMIILVNKIDTNKEFSREQTLKHIKELNPQIRDVPILFTSAKKNIGFKDLDLIIKKQIKIWGKKIKTNELNKWLNFIMKENPPPLKSGNIVKLKYISQIKVSPPKFNIFSNYPNSLTDHYKRFLSNKLKKDFKLTGLPIKILFKKTNNPYEKG